MGKKVREYKSGDFIFAKVKGYPAWPARVQRLNGKKYFVYFYGTGETANLPPNMIFDYAENKDKFLTKTVKRRDFNDGVKQIEYDFANNVPLEQVIGVSTEPSEDVANDTANDTANEVDDSTGADDTMADESTANTTQNDTGVEDSDETSGLIIDEVKAKGRKSTAKTPAKETPKAQTKTPRAKGKKEDAEEKEKDDKKEEEMVSRSGRKIRPKRYMDEHTEENTALPTPAPKKRRGATPDKDKDATRIIKHFNAVPQSELEDLKEPFTTDEPDKENILIAYLPSGQYVGIKLFQSRPTSFKNETARLQWDKQAASNALTLKMQLERGHITAQSVQAQLNVDLSLSDEEKAMLDKERETEEKKSRVQFLKTEMKLIELDAKIKTCLCLEKAETELCLKLLDELMELEVKPLMLLKHPSCLETIKRMRAYVGNTPSWDLSESAALVFSKHAHRIRRLADSIYNNMKQLFTTPEGLSFWEYFSERVMHFKKVTGKLSADELLELVHEPIEMSQPTPHTMKSAVESANELEANVDAQKKKPQTGKTKKNASATPSKTPVKRQTSKKQDDKEENEEDADKLENEKEKESDSQNSENETLTNDTEKESNNADSIEESTDKTQESEQTEKETEENKVDELNNDTDKKNDTEMETDANDSTNEKDDEEATKDDDEKDNEKESTDKVKDKTKDTDKDDAKDKKEKDKPKDSADKKDSNKTNGKEKSKDNGDKKDSKEKAKDSTEKKDKAEKRKLSVDNSSSKSKEPSPNADEKVNKDKDSAEKDKDSAKDDEPRVKRTRESKKTDQPPPRSPTKRKSKA